MVERSSEAPPAGQQVLTAALEVPCELVLAGAEPSEEVDSCRAIGL